MTSRVTERELRKSAARLAVDAVALMNRAHEDSGFEQKDLAEMLGVSPGRISQILNGDGNVRLATLARMLRASGFKVELTPHPVAEPAGAPQVVHPPTSQTEPPASHSERRIWSKRYASFTPMHVAGVDGLSIEMVVTGSDTDPRTHCGAAGPSTIFDSELGTFTGFEVVRELFPVDVRVTNREAIVKQVKYV